MKLNIANQLTIFRVILIIPFVGFLLAENYLVALVLFSVASITDLLDGIIARTFNMITNLGKFLDPLADKVLIISALICYVELKLIPAFIVTIIVAREFIVTGFRMAIIEKDNKAVIAADIWGKLKTLITMLTIIWILSIQMFLSFDVIYLHEAVVIITEVLIIICTILTVFSGFTAIWKNRKLFVKSERDKSKDD
jgi:CDP-diacylglycerol--glycerol-3-phosphate 3-phosphatidyltransferase